MGKKKEIFFRLVLAGLFLTSLVVAYGRSRHAAQKENPPQQKQGAGGPARTSPQDLEALGIVNALSDEQTDELVKQGWSRGSAHARFGQFGIDAALIDSLRAEGVDFYKAREEAGNEDPALWEGPDHTAYLLSAADAVVAGEVAKVRHKDDGPYRTEVFVKVDKSYKHELTGRTLQFNQLGGYTTNERGERVKVRASYEPEFKEGERVLLFLTETPRALRSLYTQAKSRAKDKEDDERIARGFGPKEKVERALQDKSFYEVQAAYKIVNDKAVSKSDALYATNKGHELDLAAVTDLSRKVKSAEDRIGKKRGAPRVVTQIPQ